MHVRRLLPALITTGVTLLGMTQGTTPLPGGSAVPAAMTSVATRTMEAAVFSSAASSLQSTAQAALNALSTKDSSSDPRYFLNGVWVHDGAACFRCDVGPGVAAAALAVMTGNATDRTLALSTMDTAIRLHQLPSGAFGPPAGSETTPDIQTMFFAIHLGLTMQMLGTTLDTARRTTWTQALAGAVDFLVKNGNYAWYTNGNIVLGNAVAAAMAWRATGDPRYRAVYDGALTFAYAPTPSRWPGRGLVTITPVSPTDPARGRGYLTEEGPGAPGFDADYVQMQADFAAILYLATGEQRALDLTNMLVNQLLPLVNRTTWDLDTSGGSRHPQLNRLVPFTTCALPVLAANGRADLVAAAQSQALVISTSFTDSTTYTNIGMYQSWGSRLAPALYSLH